MKMIPVLEIFGPTIQGEGAVIGKKTMFVRTAGCDYSCAWCDSAFTWDGSSKATQMTAVAIYERLHKLGGERFNHVTISGGNPALLPQLAELVTLLHEKNIRVGVETQGSKWQDWFAEIDDLTISPKPPSSGMELNVGVLDEIMWKLRERRTQVSLKVVVFDETDFLFAKDIHHKYPTVPFYVQVGNSDVVTHNDASLRDSMLCKLEWLIDLVVQSAEMNDVKVLPQLHTLLWGNKRGV